MHRDVAKRVLARGRPGAPPAAGAPAAAPRLRVRPGGLLLSGGNREDRFIHGFCACMHGMGWPPMICQEGRNAGSTSPPFPVLLLLPHSVE